MKNKKNKKVEGKEESKENFTTSPYMDDGGGIDVRLSQEELTAVVSLLGKLPTESGAWPLYDYLSLYLLD